MILNNLYAQTQEKLMKRQVQQQQISNGQVNGSPSRNGIVSVRMQNGSSVE